MSVLWVLARLLLHLKESIWVSKALTTRTASDGSEPDTAACLAAVSDSTSSVVVVVVV